MSNNVIDSFLNKKKAESKYVQLQDGESIRVLKLREVKPFTKPGFDGELKESLRLVVDCETSEGIVTKWFDNSTARFANELIEKGVEIGSSFTIKRTGVQTNTRYTISDVKSASGASVAPQTPAAPSSDNGQDSAQ